jgi:hypothetical protein
MRLFIDLDRLAPDGTLAAAISAKMDALDVDTAPDDVLATIALVDALDRALDRLALAIDAPIVEINTYAADPVAA